LTLGSQTIRADTIPRMDIERHRERRGTKILLHWATEPQFRVALAMLKAWWLSLGCRHILGISVFCLLHQIEKHISTLTFGPPRIDSRRISHNTTRVSWSGSFQTRNAPRLVVTPPSMTRRQPRTCCSPVLTQPGCARKMNASRI
jgi:hypothetical protein